MAENRPQKFRKIHFWGRKIKFSFWLNKCFWNILQLIKHIQEGYFSNFRVIDLNISHVCIKYESDNDMRDILDPINPPLFPTCTANQRTNLRLQPKLQNFCDCLYYNIYINIILLSSWWNSQRELREFILRRSEFPFPFFCFFAFERFLLSQKENLIFRPQKWIFEISEVCFLPFFSFVLCAKVALAMCHNF